jgi:hypothetical protein
VVGQPRTQRVLELLAQVRSPLDREQTRGLRALAERLDREQQVVEAAPASAPSAPGLPSATPTGA